MIYSDRIDEILNVGIPLWDVGIHNWALSKEQALDALDKLENKNIAVLGGDVLDNVKGDIGYNYSNWYTNQDGDEAWVSYVKRSIEHSRQYILRYPYEHGKTLFTIVASQRQCS